MCVGLRFLMALSLSRMALSPAETFKTSLSSERWWSEKTVAVVTGGNKGIGLALVKLLAEKGLTVVLTSRDVGRGHEAVSSLRARNLPVEYCQLDITDQASIRSFTAWLRRRFGGLDILVSNAGVSFNKVDENKVDHAETVINTNFYGSMSLIEALLPLFRRSPSKSRILNLSSQLGLLHKVRNPILRAALEDENNLTVDVIEETVSRFLKNVKDGSWEKEGWPKIWPDYSVSKLALQQYSRLLAKTQQGGGVSVNCYCPGFTKTDMTNGIGSHTAAEAAEVAVKYLLAPPQELVTGFFFKWTSKNCLPSKL